MANIAAEADELLKEYEHRLGVGPTGPMPSLPDHFRFPAGDDEAERDLQEVLAEFDYRETIADRVRERSDSSNPFSNVSDVEIDRYLERHP
jgi:hypothetical protein